MTYFLHGKPATREEVERWIREDAPRELASAYLPRPRGHIEFDSHAPPPDKP